MSDREQQMYLQGILSEGGGEREREYEREREREREREV
jgi:hypothetical protein